MDGEQGHPILVVGAGPAGLTAAYELTKTGDPVVVAEASDTVGGISRTVERDGWRFDIGGHRFFTKVPAVQALWHEILGAEDFLVRPRMSRIFYEGRFYDYPLKPLNALANLGAWESLLCGGSYLQARLRPPRDQTNYEGWLVARFGWRLYRTFFKTYTEKVWGVPVSDMPADWAAQRVKNLDLGKAVLHALSPKRMQTDVTSLIEQFQYPKYGPGMMWERCRDRVEKQGGRVDMETALTRIHLERGRAVSATLRDASGEDVHQPLSHLISTMPISELVAVLDPAPPEEVLAAGRSLHYRDFLTVALVIPDERGFPDNWIYIHAADVMVGRIQNFGKWSPYMVKDGKTCLGLEYFVFEGDALWSASDDELVAMASRELAMLGLAHESDVEAGYVVRVPKAYPYYDPHYKESVETIRSWMATHATNVHPVGRNGMHKYNNQDHSMYTAMLTVENIHGADHDIWSVNVEEEYHETDAGGSGTPGTRARSGIGFGPGDPGEGSSVSDGADDPGGSSTEAGILGGTGRDAPILPKRTVAR